jgi:ubiquinone/menaquinone biosynthesis C-methylase UbiE
MPTLEQNLNHWGQSHDWRLQGDEWSEAWGGPELQWLHTVLPRIQSFIPTDNILEIAPGFGRWTRFLAPNCKQLIGIDLNRNCTEACKKRFADSPHAQFYANNGKSLEVVPPDSIDFIFSFDSLVHADLDVIDAYLSQFPRIMKKKGAAFIHHSNCGENFQRPLVRGMLRVPLLRRYIRTYSRFGIRENHHWRSENVSAEAVRRLCTRYGLKCTRQESVNWGEDFLNDCFSIIVPCGSVTCSHDTEIILNHEFMEEVARAKRQSGQEGGK